MLDMKTKIGPVIIGALGTINLYASGFQWLQSAFAYDILFVRHLNFSTWFTKNVNIMGTKQD